jgi:polyphosphate glucokinase
MLFVGLGTGVGSALVTEHVIVPLELGCLPYGSNETLFDRLGSAGLEARGEDAWDSSVRRVLTSLREAFAADYILLGGGNAQRIHPLPEGTRRGGNEDAFTGGFRLWEEVVEPHDRRAANVWRVVR